MASIPPLRQPAAGTPFFTRRSVMGWAAVSVAALFAFGALDHSPGAGGAFSAVVFAAGIVTLVVAWIGGIVLALRLGSIFALLIAFLLAPPFGSVLVAIMTPPRRPGPPGLPR